MSLERGMLLIFIMKKNLQKSDLSGRMRNTTGSTRKPSKKQARKMIPVKQNMKSRQWLMIETEKEHKEATARFEEIREAPKGTPEYREMLLLVHLISVYEEKKWSLPDVDPIEMIKIRMEDFGYNASDLAREYGDKGTISKVLNYKQALSLTMIRKFSILLRIPVDALTKEYALH
jgi:HTH-type transcriptional regulator/antitoxin HigA